MDKLTEGLNALSALLLAAKGSSMRSGRVWIGVDGSANSIVARAANTESSAFTWTADDIGSAVWDAIIDLATKVITSGAA